MIKHPSRPRKGLKSAVEMDVSVHKILKGSRANGPGIRNVVWFQGCTLQCPGCFNPDTHDPASSHKISVTDLCSSLLEPKCDGVTISGGEPFQQPEALFQLLTSLRKNNIQSILLFSGYPYDVLRTASFSKTSLPLIDVLICGPYRKDLPPAYDRFCSSSNQELILLSDRYTTEDFCDLPLSEIIITPEGETVMSGICL